MIHLEVAFPPAEESLDVPAQLVDLSHFFSRQVMTVGGYPVILAVNAVANKSQLFLSLVDTLGTKEHNCVVKNDAVLRYGLFSDNGSGGSLLDPADKVLAVSLPLVEVGMALVPAINDGGFAFVDDLANKGALTLLAVGQEYLPRDTPVDVEADMGLGFL